MRLDGQVALVTGAGRGIGAATAERLAAEGAVVVVADLDPQPAAGVAEGIGASGGTATLVTADVTDPESVRTMVDTAVERHGRLDLMVACAGIVRDNLIHKMSVDDWDAVVDTHLKGSFLCAQAAQRVMVPQRSGRMVFISSISALGNRGQANYSAAKAGIEGLARTLSIELGRFGITVNAVAPGFTDTRLARAAAERMGLPWEKFVAHITETIPLRRICQPSDIAGVIAWLCGPDASMVSGQVISVHGGP
jgi:3-oxoacyl-[acyl-carrier protein] reductase